MSDKTKRFRMTANIEMGIDKCPADVLKDIDNNCNIGDGYYLDLPDAGEMVDITPCSIDDDSDHDVRDGQALVMINGREFPADIKMVRLLHELNMHGFTTTQHCCGHGGTKEAYLSFDLNAVDVKIQDGRIVLYRKGGCQG